MNGAGLPQAPARTVLAPTPPGERLPEGEPLQREALIRRCGLGPVAIAEIQRLQARLSIRFAEAALRLGHIVASDLDLAPATALAPVARRRPSLPAERVVLAHFPYHPRSEEIRSLRTELLLRHDDSGQANMFAVLSPCAGEGRSQLAADLAVAFAQLGRPTLLVDADLRHPHQHLLFRNDNAQGLSQALAEERPPVPQAVVGLPMLSVLHSGPVPTNPLELLSDRRFESLVEDWRQAYSFVVFDTPPVQRYADGLAVATIVGRILSLSRAGHTPYKDTRNLMRRLAATQSRVLGAVINRF